MGRLVAPPPVAKRTLLRFKCGMSTPKKKNEVTTSRIAARPQAERRVDASREPEARTAAQVSAQDVSRRAFEIWERNGRTPGRDLENWLEAEAELRGSSA